MEHYDKQSFITKLNKGSPPSGYNLQYVFLGRKKLGSKWFGEYWLEAMDPDHRYLLPWLMAFEQEYGEPTDTLIPFFNWLHQQAIPKDSPRVHYLRHLELEKTIVVPSKETLQYRLSSEICNPNQRNDYLFVIDLNQNLMLLPETEIYHHSSLSHCRPTLGSGMICLDHGRIAEIAFYCGHYLPTKQDGKQACQILLNNGFIIQDDVNIRYFENHQQKQVQFGAFYAETNG